MAAIQYVSLSLAIMLLTNLASALPILQGTTNKTSTQVSIVKKTNSSLKVRLKDKDTIIPATWQEVINYGSSQWSVLKLNYSHLKLGRTYILEVHEGDELVDRRSLETLDTDMKKPKIAVASCIEDSRLEEQKDMWGSLLARQPDLIFLIGDNTYGDWRKGTPILIPRPSDLWERYMETFNAVDLYKAEKLIPIFATWDDHDYGVNDAGAAMGWKKESKKIFFAVYPQEEVDGFLEHGPGVSSSFEAFKQRFVFLDNRSFRSKKDLKGHHGTHFGEIQETWLWQQLSDETPTWLISGDQFFGAHHPFESYAGNHSKSFDDFKENLRQIPTQVLFVSGDRHLTELQKIPKTVLGYETFEVTSSGIHSKMFPETIKKFPSPYMVAGQSGILNYVMIESEVSKSWQLNVEAVGPQNQTIYKKDLSIEGPANDRRLGKWIKAP